MPRVFHWPFATDITEAIDFFNQSLLPIHQTCIRLAFESVSFIEYYLALAELILALLAAVGFLTKLVP